MNAFWFVATRSSILGASRRARILEIIFAKLWIIVIGQKSLGQVVPIFFGSSATIKAELSLLILLQFPLLKA